MSSRLIGQANNIFTHMDISALLWLTKKLPTVIGLSLQNSLIILRNIVYYYKEKDQFLSITSIAFFTKCGYSISTTCPTSQQDEEGKMILNREEIKKIIPHRDPMLLVDTVEELIPNRRLTATFYVAPEREIFRGHFPDEPVFPGVYTVECMAQSADILLLTEDRYRGRIPLFLGINNVRFRQKILPEDTLTIEVSILSERAEKSIATCLAKVYCRTELAAEGEVTLAMR